MVSPSLSFRTLVHCVQTPAKKASGRSSPSANQIGRERSPGRFSGSEKAVKGTTQRCSRTSQRRQCGEAMLRMFVTPRSVFLPLSAKAGEGIPHRIISSTGPPSPWRTTGAG